MRLFFAEQTCIEENNQRKKTPQFAF